jgi:hypothetical protein
MVSFPINLVELRCNVDIGYCIDEWEVGDPRTDVLGNLHLSSTHARGI